MWKKLNTLIMELTPNYSQWNHVSVASLFFTEAKCFWQILRLCVHCLLLQCIQQNIWPKTKEKSRLYQYDHSELKWMCITETESMSRLDIWDTPSNRNKDVILRRCQNSRHTQVPVDVSKSTYAYSTLEPF